MAKSGRPPSGPTEKINAGELLSIRPQPRRTTVGLHFYLRTGRVEWPLVDAKPIVVGRDPGADVHIDDVTVSKRHATFMLADGKVVVEDQRSTNGTWLDSRRIQRAALSPGDHVMLGNVLVVVQPTTLIPGISRRITGHDHFLAALEDEVVRAEHFGRTFTLVFVRGNAQPPKVHEVAAALIERLTPVDRIALYSHDIFEILLPEVKPGEAHARVQELIEEAEKRRLFPFAGVAVYPEAATGTEAILSVARDALAAASARESIRWAPLSSSRAIDRGRSGDGASTLLSLPGLAGVLDEVERVARRKVPVLLRGETGVGKDVIAEAIRDGSHRRKKPFYAVNCGAIAKDLVVSTLFGHERGSFTGALERKEGVFESADGGTLMLDEIAEMPLEAQATLLRALEKSRFNRIGGSKEIEVDVRLISATHQDLQDLIARKLFREDLYYRLAVVTVEIPPLRDRPDDIEPLARRFIEDANREAIAEARLAGKHAPVEEIRQVRDIEPAALVRLERYLWPGNVRELRNVIFRAVALARTDRIAVEDLDARVRACGTSSLPPPSGDGPRSAPSPSMPRRPPPASVPPGPAAPDSTLSLLDEHERTAVVAAMEQAGGRQETAAKILGVSLRTLVRKLNKFGLQPSKRPRG